MRACFKPKKHPLNYLHLLLVVGGVAAFGILAGNAGSSNEEAASDRPVYLYFGEPAGRFLTGEPIAMGNSGDGLLFCRQIIEALIEGPAGSLIPTLGENTKLRTVFISGRTAYVDFSREIAEAHPGGVRSELLTVYSIVNTLVLNMEEIDRVKILVEGNEAETLVGHIAIAYPLTAQMLLVR